MGDERLGTGLPQLGGQGFDAGAAVAEHEPLFATVKRGDNVRRVPDIAHVVQLYALADDRRFVGPAGATTRRGRDDGGREPFE